MLKVAVEMFETDLDAEGIVDLLKEEGVEKWNVDKIVKLSKTIKDYLET